MHTCWGQAKTEKGNKADENQVSRTSSSCFNVIFDSSTLNFFAAFPRASSFVRPDTQ